MRFQKPSGDGFYSIHKIKPSLSWCNGFWCRQILIVVTYQVKQIKTGYQETLRTDLWQLKCSTKDGESDTEQKGGRIYCSHELGRYHWSLPEPGEDYKIRQGNDRMRIGPPWEWNNELVRVVYRPSGKK